MTNVPDGPTGATRPKPAGAHGRAQPAGRQPEVGRLDAATRSSPTSRNSLLSEMNGSRSACPEISSPAACR